MQSPAARPPRRPPAAVAPEAVTLRAVALMFARGAINGAAAPFATVLLIRSGITPALVGPLAAAAAVATLLTAPAWGRLGDRHGRRRVLAVAFLIASPAALGHASGSPWILVPAYLAWSAIASAFMPLVDSLVLTRLGGSGSRFSRVRVGASTAYMTAVIVVGAVITVTALGWAAPGLVAFVLCLGGAALTMARLRGELRTGTGVGAHSQVGLLEGAGRGVRRHWLFLVGVALVFAGANAPFIFTGPRVAEVGGNGWEIGLAIAAGTLVELPAFLSLPWLMRATGPRRLFLAGGLLLGVAGILSAIAPTPELQIATRLLFGAGFAWVTIPSLSALTNAASVEEHAASAALHFAASSAGSLLVALAGLPLVGLTGSVAPVLAAAAIAAPIGAVLALRAWPAARSGVPTPAVTAA
jgi:MFS family permease